MKRSALVLGLLLAGCNPNKTALDAGFHPTQRNWGSLGPVWSDEFDTTGVSGPDPAKWVIAKYCGGSNNEQQCYTDSLQNIQVDGAGHLVITALPEQPACDGETFLNASGTYEIGESHCPASGNFTPTYSFSSARIHTRFPTASQRHKWRYGRVEIRAKLPYGQGTWPAFWMLSDPQTPNWPESGEIDIMEASNLHSPNKPADYIQANIHLCRESGYTTNTGPGNQTSVCSSVKSDYVEKQWEMKLTPIAPQGCVLNLSDDFHTYAMEWSDVDMRFFFDDQLVGWLLHSRDGHNFDPFANSFYLIINLAVGGNMPANNPPTTLTDTSTWLDSASAPKARLVLDWVRVYTCVPDPSARNCIYQGQGLGPNTSWTTQVACVNDHGNALDHALRTPAPRPEGESPSAARLGSGDLP